MNKNKVFVKSALYRRLKVLKALKLFISKDIREMEINSGKLLDRFSDIDQTHESCDTIRFHHHY